MEGVQEPVRLCPDCRGVCTEMVYQQADFVKLEQTWRCRDCSFVWINQYKQVCWYEPRNPDGLYLPGHMYKHSLKNKYNMARKANNARQAYKKD